MILHGINDLLLSQTVKFNNKDMQSVISYKTIKTWAEFMISVIRNNCKICTNEKVRRAVDEKLIINELWPKGFLCHFIMYDIVLFHSLK